MTKAFDVVVVGELNVDLVLNGLAKLPELGSCIRARDMNLTLGSASAIFACNIARLGARVGFVGKVGGDSFGGLVLDSLRGGGVDVSRVIIDKGARTGVCVSLSYPGEYAQASYAGVRETFSLPDVDMDYVLSARHLHLSSYYIQPALIPGCPQLFRTAKEHGLSTSLDPDGDQTGRWDAAIYDVLDNVDVFLPNEREARCISGRVEIEEALETLCRHSRTVVIKRGTEGAIARNGDTLRSWPAFPVDAVDTTGAGDSFNAGFVWQMLNGGGLDDCLRLGNACAALSTRALGGTTSFPTLEEAETFLRSVRTSL